MTWPELLGALTRGEEVELDRIRWAMREVMAGAASPAQIAAFVVALRMRGERADQIAALVDVMLEFSERIDAHGIALDTCGTGGDGAHTVNISTMAAVLLASAGVPIVKHGNRAASSKCGSADVLEALGVRIDGDRDAAQRSFDELSLTFCFAPVFHPALRFAGPTRRELGIPTVFNLLGPLANPAAPQAQLVGVADLTKAPLIVEALRIRGTAALVVRGEDGLDEISIFAPTRIWATWLDEPITMTPAELGIGIHEAGALAGGDAQHNASVARRLLDGAQDADLAAARDAVVINAAFGAVAVDVAHGRLPTDLQSAVIRQARDLHAHLASGAPGRLLDRWIEVTNR